MRWREHFDVGKQVLWNRNSDAYKLGLLLPDWFERKHWHRTEDTLDMIVNRIEMTRKLEWGTRRDFVLGTIVHFLCDYCTYSHENMYNDFTAHAKHEIDGQKWYLRKRKRNSDDVNFEAVMAYNNNIDRYFGVAQYRPKEMILDSVARIRAAKESGVSLRELHRIEVECAFVLCQSILVYCGEERLRFIGKHEDIIETMLTEVLIGEREDFR